MLYVIFLIIRKIIPNNGQNRLIFTLSLSIHLHFFLFLLYIISPFAPVDLRCSFFLTPFIEKNLWDDLEVFFPSSRTEIKRLKKKHKLPGYYIQYHKTFKKINPVKSVPFLVTHYILTSGAYLKLRRQRKAIQLQKFSRGKK